MTSVTTRGVDAFIYLKKMGLKTKKKGLRELNVRIIQARNARRLFCYF